MNKYNYIVAFIIIILLSSCKMKQKKVEFQVFETSERGNKLTKVSAFKHYDSIVSITLYPEQTLQTISGFGGAFTE